MFKKSLIFLLFFYAFQLFSQDENYHWYQLSGQKSGGIDFSSSVLTNSLIINVTIPGFKYGAHFYKNIEFSDLYLENEDSTIEKGEPRLPSIHRMIDLSEWQNYKINYDIVEKKNVLLSDLKLDKEIFPFQPSLPKIPGAAEKAIIYKNEKIYSSNDFYPSSVVELQNISLLRGKKIGMLVINPVRYNPVKRAFEIYSRLKVSIAFSKIKTNKAYSNDSEIDQLLESSLINKASIESKTIFTQNKGFKPKEGLLVITTDKLAANNSLKNFIIWKKEKGFKVELATTEVIAKEFPTEKFSDFKNENNEDPSASPSCKDTAIRKFVQKIYKKWTAPRLTYVMIIGDHEYVSAHEGGSGYKKQLTDNFYAAIDTDNYGNDIISPDLAIGRLSIKSGEELDLVINKILNYEKGDFEDSSWVKKIAFIGTDDSGNYQIAEGTHNYVIEKFTKGLKFFGIFPEDPFPGGDTLYAITHNADTVNTMKSINNGRLIVNYSGHGSQTYWAGPQVTQEGVKGITHKSAKPFVVSNACLTNSFGMTGGDCFGETWLKSKNGAIAFWGASNVSYWDEDDIEEKEMFAGIFDKEINSFGLIALNGLLGVNKKYAGGGRTSYYYEIYNVLGDPTSKLWTEKPASPEVELNTTDDNEVKKIAVKVSVAEKPVANATVALLINKGSQFVAETDENGETTIPIQTKAKSAKIKVTVTKANLIPFQKLLTLE